MANDFERQRRDFFVGCLKARGLSDDGANDLANSVFGSGASTQTARNSPGQAAVDISMVSAMFDDLSKLATTCTPSIDIGLEAKKEIAAEKEQEKLMEKWDEEQRVAQESIQMTADALNESLDGMFTATVRPYMRKVFREG